jgi:replicative superfamily II helicase
MKTAMTMREMATQKGQLSLFAPNENRLVNAKRIFERAKAKQLCDLLPYGFGIHHAGLLRHDRYIVERNS